MKTERFVKMEIVELAKIVILEGDGTRESMARNVEYYCYPDGKIFLRRDPCDFSEEITKN